MSESARKRVVIVGAGFAGLNAAKVLAGRSEVDITLIDRRNHHLFQPLLYQVAMAGLSPADIAMPIRHLLAGHDNIKVLQGEVTTIDRVSKVVSGDFGSYPYDYLVLAAGAQHSYFGHEEWEEHAPGLKNLEQATEIRRRVLSAFEAAERENSPERRRWYLTFVVVGGGPTGVELAGAIGEMSRYTLAEDFKAIDPRLTRVILIEAGTRILPMFDPELSSVATRSLEQLGVQIWTNSMVTGVDAQGVQVGNDRIASATVVWAAGVQASPLSKQLDTSTDRLGRVLVTPDLTLPNHPEIFVLGDQAHSLGKDGKPLPGVAPVALQQGRYCGKRILAEIRQKKTHPFHFVDKGQMATIGRRRAIVQFSGMKISGWLAWFMWLFVHIYYLTGFKNRVLVLIQWGWSYFTFGRGARLIVSKDWRSYPPKALPTVQQVALPTVTTAALPAVANNNTPNGALDSAQSTATGLRSAVSSNALPRANV